MSSHPFPCVQVVISCHPELCRIHLNKISGDPNQNIGANGTSITIGSRQQDRRKEGRIFSAPSPVYRLLFHACASWGKKRRHRSLLFFFFGSHSESCIMTLSDNRCPDGSTTSKAKTYVGSSSFSLRIDMLPIYVV